MKFVIKGELPDLNTYIDECRSNKYAGNHMKQSAQKYVCDSIRAQIKRMGEITQPVQIRFLWVTKDARKDIDNVAFAKKFILDAMVKSKLLPDDSRKWVKGFTDEFIVDKSNPRTEVEIREVKK
jgi:Holliday junction resolvase RusA-like endonuclease